MDQQTRRGRKKGTLNGELRTAVAQYIRHEDPSDPWTDREMARVEECSEPNIQYARKVLGIPNSRVRGEKGWRVAASLARCPQCCRSYELPEDKAFRYCPEGHGRIYLSSVRLELRDAD